MKMKDKVNYRVESIERTLNNFKFNRCFLTDTNVLSEIKGQIEMLWQLDLIDENTFYHLIGLVNVKISTASLLAKD